MKVFCFMKSYHPEREYSADPVRTDTDEMLEFKFVETSVGKVHAVVGGEGEPLLLVHGFGDSNSWRTWVKNVDALSMIARVYALELPGYGESDQPTESLDATGHANVMLELMDKENIERASVIGLSWGGQVTQELTEKYPERVNKIVLVDSLFDSSEEGLAHLARIQAPTLIVWDEEDAVIPAQWAHILGMAIRDSRLRILTPEQRDPDANPQNKHWTQMTHSLWFNKIVTEFLAHGDKRE
jgi:pimeloyl-ACP methyl ester carboxylesterase